MTTRLALLSLLLVVPAAHAERRDPPGCREIYRFGTLAHVNGDRDSARSLKQLYKAVCAKKVDPGTIATYPDGSVATYQAKIKGATYYYLGGKIATLRAGQRQPWQWPNGNLVTYSAVQPHQGWFYSNGATVTLDAGAKGASWFYANGRPMTFQAGIRGAAWFKPDGSLLEGSGPDLNGEELLDIPIIVYEMLEGDDQGPPGPDSLAFR
jgi:hypothetical protein